MSCVVTVRLVGTCPQKVVEVLSCRCLMMTGLARRKNRELLLCCGVCLSARLLLQCDRYHGIDMSLDGLSLLFRLQILFVLAE